MRLCIISDDMIFQLHVMTFEPPPKALERFEKCLFLSCYEVPRSHPRRFSDDVWGNALDGTLTANHPQSMFSVILTRKGSKRGFICEVTESTIALSSTEKA